MAPKSAYTEQRIQKLIDEAVAKHTTVSEDGVSMMNLSCEYLGVIGSDGATASKDIVRGRSLLAFSWQGERDGLHTATVHRRCDNAFRDGIPLPSAWHQLTENDRILQDLIDIAKEVSIKQKAPCEYLGLKLSNGGFEQHPRKWKTKRQHEAEVYFEWVSQPS